MTKTEREWGVKEWEGCRKREVKKSNENEGGRKRGKERERE